MAAMESGVASAAESAGMRHRCVPENDPNWDSSLPYGGKVFLARKKRADPFHIRAIEVYIVSLILRI